MEKFFNKILEVLKKFDADPAVGGLRITSSVVQYVEREKGKHFEVRLSQGAIRDGVLADAESIKEAFLKLHEIIAPGRAGKMIKVVVALPPQIVFTQVVRVPLVEEDKLDETAILNLRMAIPTDFEGAYLSWQKIKETGDQFELLGASAERIKVDAFRDALITANFSPVAFEFPGLALVRTTSSVVVPTETVLLVNLTDEGMGFSVVHNGVLYFDSFVTWSEVTGKGDGIEEESKRGFQEILAWEIKRVSDFSLNRLGKEFGSVFFVAPGFEAEVGETIIGSAPAGAKVQPFSVPDSPVTPDFYVALGSAMRGSVEKDGRRFINFGSLEPGIIFLAERAENFIRFWRNVFAGALAVLLIACGAVASFLVAQHRVMEVGAGALGARGSGSGLTAIEAKVQEFNHLVGLVRGLRETGFGWEKTLRAVYALADQSEVAILNMEAAQGGRVAVTGKASDYLGVLMFKDVISRVTEFHDVNLPLSRISSVGDNSVGFTLSFTVK